jgi:hypothetical protein
MLALIFVILPLAIFDCRSILLLNLSPQDDSNCGIWMNLTMFQGGA